MDRTHHHVVASQQFDEPRLVEHVTLLGRDFWKTRDLLGMAGDGRDGVAAIGEFF